MPDAVPPSPGVSWRRLAPLALLVAAGVIFVVVGGNRYLSASTLAENRALLCDMAARWGFVSAAAFIAVYAAMVALSVPGGAILTVTGGFLFGTGLGGLYAMVGATLGAAVIFLAARAGLHGLGQRAGRPFNKLEAGFRADAFNYLLVLRLVPLFPFWLVNLVPALAGVGLRTFVLATLIGIIPGTFIYASLGNGLGTVVDQPDLGVLCHPGVLGPMVGLAVLALVPVWYRRRQRRKTAWPRH